MIKTLIVDDQKLVRQSLSYLLESNEDIKVVGLAENGLEAIQFAEKNEVEIILMDIEMPILDGISATKRIKEKFPNIKIIILTTFENPDNILESFVNKADGYIVKDISHTDLINTIRCVNSGLCVLHESVRKIMIDRFKGLSDYRTSYKEILTEREIEIVKYIALGFRNKEIAAKMNYSLGTIKNNISKILEKLDMVDRLQIAIFAIEKGII